MNSNGGSVCATLRLLQYAKKKIIGNTTTQDSRGAAECFWSHGARPSCGVPVFSLWVGLIFLVANCRPDCDARMHTHVSGRFLAM